MRLIKDMCLTNSLSVLMLVHLFTFTANGNLRILDALTLLCRILSDPSFSDIF